MSDICKVLQKPDWLERRMNPRAVGFGIFLRAMRERAGVSMKDLATALGMSVSGLSAIETGGEMPPKDWTLDMIGDLLEDIVRLKMEEI